MFALYLYISRDDLSIWWRRNPPTCSVWRTSYWMKLTECLTWALVSDMGFGKSRDNNAFSQIGHPGNLSLLSLLEGCAQSNQARSSIIGHVQSNYLLSMMSVWQREYLLINFELKYCIIPIKRPCPYKRLPMFLDTTNQYNIFKKNYRGAIYCDFTVSNNLLRCFQHINKHPPKMTYISDLSA